MSKCMWCAELFVEQHLYSIWHQAVQVVGIPMDTNSASVVADLFLFCYERVFMMSHSDDKQADVVNAFSTSIWTIFKTLTMFILTI